MVSLSHLLDVAYLLVILVVAVGGMVGVWWLNRSEGEHGDRSSEWRGLLVTAAASLFVFALVVQFLWHVFDTAFNLFGV